MYNISKFSTLSGLSKSCLRQYDKLGKLIPSGRTPTGHRRYTDSDLNKLIGVTEKPKQIVLYARVSGNSQKDDLVRQVQLLEDYATSKGYEYKVIEDVGSGINYTKKGLQQLLREIEMNQVSKIVVLYKDRLLRFGLELIEYICELHQVQIEVINHTEKPKQEELTEDLLLILTVFANRMYGQRSHKNKKLLDTVKSTISSNENIS
jgi:putative resolvase